MSPHINITLTPARSVQLKVRPFLCDGVRSKDPLPSVGPFPLQVITRVVSLLTLN